MKFRLFDVFSGQEMGEGLQLGGTTNSWRRLAHKVADTVYSRITGEGPYFDSRVVFVSEAGPKDARQKRLAIMDYDGANVQYLTDSSSIVLAPRFRPMATACFIRPTKPDFRKSTFLMLVACSAAR